MSLFLIAPDRSVSTTTAFDTYAYTISVNEWIFTRTNMLKVICLINVLISICLLATM